MAEKAMKQMICITDHADAYEKIRCWGKFLGNHHWTVGSIYLVDMQWGGPEAAYSVFEEMQGWFSRNMPSVKTVIRRASDGPFTSDDPKLRKEIVEKKIAGAVIGIGG
jgi:hypothetical protein